MNDGVPDHYFHVIVEYLNSTYGNRFTGQNGAV